MNSLLEQPVIWEVLPVQISEAPSQWSLLGLLISLDPQRWRHLCPWMTMALRGEMTILQPQSVIHESTCVTGALSMNMFYSTCMYLSIQTDVCFKVRLKRRCNNESRWMSLTDERESYEPMSFMPHALQERIEPNVFNWRAWKLRAHSFTPSALHKRIEPNVFKGWMLSVLKDNSLPSRCGQRALLEKNQISGTISIDRR